MTTETQGAPGASTNTPASAGTQASATPAAPAPGSPEYQAAMIAAYEAQFGKIDLPATAEPAATQATPTDPNAPSPKLTDPPVDQTDPNKPKDSEAPKDGETPSDAPSLGALFEKGDVLNALGAEKVPDEIAADLKKLGLTDEQLAGLNARVRGLLALETEVATTKLHTAAGGKAEFDALVAWGQKNLSVEQREYFDGQLNGPMAAEAIAVLKQRMNAGQDPKLTLGSGGSKPVVTGYRSNQELVAAMADPRYWTDAAYHNDVKQKLAVSTF